MSEPERESRPELLRVSTVATELGLSRAYTYELIENGAIPSVRLGGTSIRVPRRALDAWVEMLSVEALASASSKRRARVMSA